ncbi:uncharacterized protein LOC109706928 [Ananas comosus]|uniref:Uncharacterized protein LOC109706928 n=2 Tax=Ananas comosus TaxID=4615 RepID=A0A199VRW4_ANACO|nr:uncharacterized protein LOC109706928 [Ananas comosus]OAY79809.1 hypothetical protein ACMD2_04208 [Ananas comosus]CAD1825495.1 unnamed protein product [Ananas comosus var. bracteatus]
MAISCYSPVIIIPKVHTRSSMARATMLHNSRIQVTGSSIPLRKSCMMNKVSEDQLRGIVCYEDEKGEVICEGYDEGPRFGQQSPETYVQRCRELSTTDFVELMRLQVDEDHDFHQFIWEKN